MTSRIGDSVEGVFPIAGSAVPLRPGSWLVLSEVRKTAEASAYVTYFLGLVDDGRLKEGMRVTSLISDLGGKDLYPALKPGENELYNVTENNVPNGGQSSWAIYNYILNPWLDFHDKTTGISDIESDAAREIHKRNIALPSEFLVARFHRREPSRALAAHYFIDVESTPAEQARVLASWRESEFAPLNIRKHPEKFALFLDIVGWASGWWSGFCGCFDNFQPTNSW